jgi:hypothetical protein
MFWPWDRSITITASSRFHSTMGDDGSQQNHEYHLSCSMKMASPTILRNLMVLRETMQGFHPLLIEGPGARDTRDATVTANRIIDNLKQHFVQQNVSKPVILVTQGDPFSPLTPNGISAVTRHVASGLGLDRGLVCLDDGIDPEHSVNADRHGVIYEMKYSQMIDLLHAHDDKVVNRLLEAVDQSILDKNERRHQLGKKSLAYWYKDYALLQEVTKSALKVIAGDITVAHSATQDDIGEFSVTNFYQVGLGLFLIDDNDMVSY